MPNIFQKLQSVHHNYLYLILIVVTFVPLLFPLGLGIGVGRLERAAYDTIQATPTGSKVIFYAALAQWAVGSYSPYIVLVEHLFQRGMQIVFVPHAVAGLTFIPRVLPYCPSATGKAYGVDWIILAMLPDLEANHASFAVNIPGSSPNDGVQKKPLATFPIMNGVTTVADFALGIYQEEKGDSYIRQVAGPFGLPSIAIHGIDNQPYHTSLLEAGIIDGAVDGVPATAAYENIIGLPAASKFSSQQMDMMSLAVVYAIVLVAIGNIAYFTKRMEKASTLAQSTSSTKGEA